MKKVYSLLFLLVLAISVSAQTHSRVANHSAILLGADIIVRHVNVITMADSIPLTNQMVVITKGFISYMGEDKGESIKTNGREVDATGKYLMPGLAEMHAHLPETGNIKNYFTLNLLAGVTTIRSMRGQSAQLAYKDITSYPVPNLYISIDPVTSKTMFDAKRADMFGKIINNTKFDFIKILSVHDSATFDNIAAAAKKNGIPICGHKPKQVSLEHVLHSGYKSISHLGGYTELYNERKEALQKALMLTKQKEVYQDITLDWYNVVYHQTPEKELLARAGMEYMHDSVKQNWVQRRKAERAKFSDSAYKEFQRRGAKEWSDRVAIIKQMNAMDIGLLIGSEGGGDFMVAGFNMIEEMKAMQQAGLSNYELLQCATINAATMMRQENKWGTIGNGKQANMILLPSNPITNLDAITKVEAVILHNELYTKTELLEQLGN